MARRRKRRSVAGLLITAGLLVIAAIVAVSYSSGDPEPVTFVEGYDDDWGKLDAPVRKSIATEILITWRDSVVAEADINRQRSKEDARKLAEELWQRYRDAPVVERQELWTQMLTEYSDRTRFPEARRTYPPANQRQHMPDAFNDVARTTQKGFVRIGESEQGIHLIRREP